jgi:amicoumacin kinase
MKIRLNGGFHNEVFYDEGLNKVIRISETKKTKEMVGQELQWMQHLYSKGVPVPKPAMIIESEGGRVRTSFEYINGESIDVTNSAHWNVGMFQQMGKIAGKMHALSKDFYLEEVHRPQWTEENPDVFQLRGKLSTWLLEKYDLLMERLYAFKITPDNFGLIHNDFHQGNLIIRDEASITVIDFDECSYNWFAQDIAVCFYHAYWQHDSFNGDGEAFCSTFLRHFFDGYMEENLLHPDTVEQIPIFLKLREIFLYSLFMRKWDMNSLEDWQKYTLRDLEERIKKETVYAGIGDFSEFI